MSSDYIFRKATLGGFNRDDVMAYINTLKAEESKLIEEKNAMQKEIDSLKAENHQLSQKADEIQQECNNQLEANKAMFNDEIEKLQAEFEQKLQTELESNRTAEEKVGSAMIDVRRYADMLLQETCHKIDKMSADADVATAKTLSRVLDITSGIQAFSDKLNATLNDIIAENEEICRELTGFKGSLRLPFETASGKLETEVLNEI